MVQDNLQSEVEELRAQLAQIKAQRACPKGQITESSEKPTTTSASRSIPQRSHHDDMNKEFGEFVQMIGNELKNTNPITIITTFALGVLVGRLFSK